MYIYGRPFLTKHVYFVNQLNPNSLLYYIILYAFFLSKKQFLKVRIVCIRVAHIFFFPAIWHDLNFEIERKKELCSSLPFKKKLIMSSVLLCEGCAFTHEY
jgi:hypothetical protein